MTELPVKAVSCEGNYLWLSNTQGVLRINLRDKSNVIAFNENTGLPSRSGNSQALRVDDYGTKWVGTANGISYSLSHNQEFYKTKTPILTFILMNGRGIPLYDLNKEPLPNNAFLELSVISLTFPGKLLRYQYKLDGAKGWIDAGAQHYYTMTDLEAGEHVIQARAKQRGNYLWSDPATYYFTVSRPLYLEWGFICLVVFGISLLVAIAYQIYHRRLIRTRQRLHSLVEERTSQLRHSNDELMRTNKELDMFVYSASHDLKAPLSSMIGLLNIYDMETSDDVKKELISRMRQSVFKLDSFIKDVIAYSKNSRLEIIKEPVDFDEVIKEVLDSYKYLDHYSDIFYDIQVEQKLYVSDKNRIRIIFNNLISNSIRYCDLSKDQPFIYIRVSESYGKIIIEVEDNGIGISGQHLKRVFEMFYRADESSAGSGLGLYIVREAINLLGGYINVASTPDIGTTFSIQLPNYKD